MNGNVTMTNQPPLKSRTSPSSEARPPAESLAKVQARLGASASGLTHAEAQHRLAQYGYNEISEETTSPILKFLSYFWGPIPWMIEIAAILSALVHHWENLSIILALLMVNGLVGFWEEYQAGNTIAALGILMKPIGWQWALFVWGYALLWFLVNDRVKLAAYRIFDPNQPGLLTKPGA